MKLMTFLALVVLCTSCNAGIRVDGKCEADFETMSPREI